MFVPWLVETMRFGAVVWPSLKGLKRMGNKGVMGMP
jgi:hypothetical protein